MSLMSTYGTLNRVGNSKSREYENNGVKRRKTFKYPEVVYNNYQHRDSVDNHNAFRMFPVALEETWKTTRWANRVFQFLLAVTEVNIKLTLEQIYGREETTMLNFRKTFAYALINNDYLREEARPLRRSPRSERTQGHSFKSLPPFKTFSRAGHLVDCKTKYIQLWCKNKCCRVRTYCTCTPGRMLCNDCFHSHCLDGE